MEGEWKRKEVGQQKKKRENEGRKQKEEERGGKCATHAQLLQRCECKHIKILWTQGEAQMNEKVDL